VSVVVVDAQPFADAIKSAMQAQSIAYAEGRKPAVAPGLPYVVGWLDPGTVSDSSLRGRDGWSLIVVLQSYALAPDSVRVAVRKSRAAMFGLNGATVGGRLIGLATHVTPPPMQRDDKADPQIWWQSDEWHLPTTPA
jgi:hypothetical protein